MAAPSDALAIAALMTALGYPTEAPEMGRRLELLAADPDYRTLVAEQDGVVRGVGTELVGASEAWAREIGAAAIVVNSGAHRVEAHRFYRRRGYDPTGLRFVKAL